MDARLRCDLCGCSFDGLPKRLLLATPFQHSGRVPLSVSFAKNAPFAPKSTHADEARPQSVERAKTTTPSDQNRSLQQLDCPDGHLLRAGINLSKSTRMSIMTNTSDDVPPAILSLTCTDILCNLRGFTLAPLWRHKAAETVHPIGVNGGRSSPLWCCPVWPLYGNAASVLN